MKLWMLDPLANKVNYYITAARLQHGLGTNLIPEVNYYAYYLNKFTKYRNIALQLQG